MLILGIESAGTQVGCAVGGHEGVLASAHSGRGRRHAEALAPQIDFVRRQAGIEISEIAAVAVDVGPGLFTGLRVGIATAVAMAYGLGVPMIPVPSQALGPRCIAGTNDTNSTPHACEPWEQGLVEGPCKPCPGTAGSDCSRCDNWWHGQTSCAAVSNPKLARRAAPRLTRARSGPTPAVGSRRRARAARAASTTRPSATS